MKLSEMLLGGALAFVLWKTGIVTINLDALTDDRDLVFSPYLGPCDLCGKTIDSRERVVLSRPSDGASLVACNQAEMEQLLLYGRPDEDA